MRNRPGSAPTSSTYRALRRGCDHAVADPGAPHRIEQARRVAHRAAQAQLDPEPHLGALRARRVIRPWLGLSPTSPQHDAGMRMLPPPSDALANGTIPTATAAAAPPLDPPDVRSNAHGLRVGPQANGCVVGRLPISGLLVRPAMTNPAALNLDTSVVSAVSILAASFSAMLPFDRV